MTKTDLPFLQHLAEVRKRLIFILIAVVLATGVSFCFANEILKFLSEPFTAIFSSSNLIGTGPAEAFVLKLKTALFAGCLLALPIIFYQIWAFIAPGLYTSEKKLILPFVFFSSLLFIVGASFCYYLVLPYAFQFFIAEYTSVSITPQIRISELLSFILTTLSAFGVVFDVPVIAFILARASLLTPNMLISWGRPAIVAIFIIAAILTPPDVLTQLLMAVPLLLLYGLSILIVKICYKKRT